MTTTTKTLSPQYIAQVAKTIRRQIEVGVLFSLGARQFAAISTSGGVKPALAFNATILPYRKDGSRGTGARTMLVEVALNALDLYDITVTYRNRGELVTHESIENVDAFSLSRVLLSLDSDEPRA